MGLVGETPIKQSDLRCHLVMPQVSHRAESGVKVQHREVLEDFEYAVLVLQVGYHANLGQSSR